MVSAVQIPLSRVSAWAKQAAEFTITNDASKLKNLMSQMTIYRIGNLLWRDAVRQLAVGYGIAYPENVDLETLGRSLPSTHIVAVPPFLKENPLTVVFTERHMDTFVSRSLSLSFKKAPNAKRTARFLMRQLMNAIASEAIRGVGRFEFKHHDEEKGRKDLPIDMTYSPYGPSSGAPSVLALLAGRQIDGGLKEERIRRYQPDYVVIDGPQRSVVGQPNFKKSSQIRARWLPGTEGIRFDAEIVLLDPTDVVGNDPSPFENLAIEMRQFCFSAGGTFDDKGE